MGLEKKLIDLENAFSRLRQSYDRAFETKGSKDFEFFRDSTIQRFEFNVEILWKTIKEFLSSKEGVECRTPKSCIREFFVAGYLTPEDAKILLEIIDYRNLTSHTYHEEIADKIFEKLKIYIPTMQKAINKIKEHLQNL